jgi:hypothetical protein
MAVRRNTMAKHASPTSSNNSTVSLSMGPALLSAALAGLMGAPGCQTDQPDMPTDASMPEGKVISTMVEPEMTLDMFTAECTDQHGKLEMHSHCGGMNSCKGFSYDTSSHVFSEHTCKALNTCSGFSCVTPEDAG